ncbi:thioredoxin domain-containing protein [Roseomonas sp. BN140053]|uniref:thioredoxin domain-containing protein n=1 Tax=Roseomonas sp. BN140053 TaxID=3391898 RepID=UPI0039ED777F
MFTTDRRGFLLASALAAPALGLSGARAQAPATDPRLGERSAGKADAPATAIEYFSLTCSHCAAFHRETWPQVKRELVETGKLRMVWREFPLDQLALSASVAARALPPERYEGFISALLGSQDRWAFARGVDSLGEIAKIAALAGMSRADFDRAQADDGLKRGILQMRLQAEREHQVNSTPTFVFGSRVVPGEIPFERFAENVRQNSRS